MPATSIAGFASLPERVRAFIALRLDAAVEDAIAALIERLRAPENDIRKRYHGRTVSDGSGARTSI